MEETTCLQGFTEYDFKHVSDQSYILKARHILYLL